MKYFQEIKPNELKLNEVYFDIPNPIEGVPMKFMGGDGPLLFFESQIPQTIYDTTKDGFIAFTYNTAPNYILIEE
jgi:hypothetical protein